AEGATAVAEGATVLAEEAGAFIEGLESTSVAEETAVAEGEVEGEIEGQTTQSLRTNMAKANRAVQQGEHGHHVVAQNAKAAQPARDVLAKFKISVHNEANGARMNAARHLGTHTRAYYEAINRAIVKAGARGRDAVVDMLRNLAKALEGPPKPPPP